MIAAGSTSTHLTFTYNDYSPSMPMSKAFIGGAVCREFESEVPTVEKMLDRVICNSEQFRFQMCLESGDGLVELKTESSRQLVP